MSGADGDTMHIIRVMPTVKQLGTVIFLHGSGDSGPGVKEWVKSLIGKDMTFPHLKLLYPTAPYRPYTPLDGQGSNVWFDRQRIAPDVPEHLESVDNSVKQLTKIVNAEVKSGIPIKNIIIGGFSMGGAMAMHLGYRSLFDVGGIFALSAFLNDNSVVFKELDLKTNTSLPPLFMCHGDRDDLVPLEWGQKSFDILKDRYGIKGQFHVLRNTIHELKEKEINHLSTWILEQIPQR